MNHNLISLESLFQEAWRHYRKHWITLFAVSFIGVMVWKVWGWFVLPTVLAAFGITAITTVSIMSGGVAAIIVLMLTLVVALEVTFWMSSAVLVTISSGDKSPGVGSVLSESRKFIWPLSVAGLYVMLVTVAGLIVLIIPGLIILFLMQFVNYVVVAEKRTGWHALTRSTNLVKSHFFGILWRNFVMIVILTVVNLFFGNMEVFSFLFATIITPYIILYHYLLYKNIADRTA